MATEIPRDNPRSHTTTLTASPKGAAICRRLARRQLTDWELHSTHTERYHGALLIVADVDLTWRRVSAGQVTFFHAHRWNFHGCSRRR
ncbi:hypothetical protein ACFRMQ_37945, partial [Kitasatospora sp. NPDC056783]|uniref:hypothetical protein n=1 Tax=Kitasatospora sp. NPDC056783 TaxID=3345943 RepID=UPI003675CDB4